MPSTVARRKIKCKTTAYKSDEKAGNGRGKQKSKAQVTLADESFRF
jgi:hypothetical protein